MNLSDVEQINREMVRAIVELQGIELEQLLEKSMGYKVPSPAQLKAKISGKSGGLTRYVVKRLRKEFLALMKAVRKAKNYDEAMKVRRAVLKWSNHYEDVIAQIRPEIDKLIATQQSWSPNPENLQVNVDWAKEFRDKQDDIWDLNRMVGDFPIYDIVIDIRDRYRRGPVPTKEEKFEKFKKDAVKWETSVKRKARLSWKWLESFIGWTERQGSYGGGGKPIPVRNPQDDPVIRDVHGFHTQMRGYDHGDESHRQELKDFEGGLAYYKQRANKVMPWLVKYKVPFILHFVKNPRLMKSDAAATYSWVKSLVNVNIYGMAGNHKKVANVLAHEMGHHLWEVFLSKKMRDDWSALITGSETTLDLRKILAKAKPGETDIELGRRLKKEDPLLAIQLDTLLYNRRYANKGLFDVQSYREYLADGGDPIISVPGKPITGYASFSPQEAFCEALGMLVGYGPRALIPDIRAALKILFPRLKVESKRELSAAFHEALS